jgi:hypothetical protein
MSTVSRRQPRRSNPDNMIPKAKLPGGFNPRSPPLQPLHETTPKVKVRGSTNSKKKLKKNKRKKNWILTF